MNKFWKIITFLNEL